jgi:succinate dehydrogenase / fumarate reductase, flavoprotein subunit
MRKLPEPILTKNLCEFTRQGITPWAALWVDYNMMTTVPGLFAIGEANFSVHGANRLGAASLMQCSGDGYFIIPYTIADYLSDQIKVPKFKTDLPEFEKVENEVRDLTNELLAVKGRQTPSTFP